MSSGPDTLLPAVASLWIGGSLNWLHELSLASFVWHGHRVVVFYTGPEAPAVPEGVETIPAAEVWDPAENGLADGTPAMLSDIFRLHLLKQTDMIWIDTDMVAVRPLPVADYHVGFEPPGSVNGAVLRLPKDSKTLNQLLDWFADPEWVPPWLGKPQQAEVAAVPPGRRLLKSIQVNRPSLGPRALQYTLRKSGELHHAVEPDVFYPIRGVMTDVFFSGYCGDDTWLTDDTLAVHLYASLVRPYHKNHRPEDNSFIARTARKIGFDLSGLKQQNRGNR